MLGRSRVLLAVVLAARLSACTRDNPAGPPPDAADDSSPPFDLGASDLASVDLFVYAGDLAQAGDSSPPLDLAAPDLTSPPDLVAAVDLEPALDLSLPPDFASVDLSRADLTVASCPGADGGANDDVCPGHSLGTASENSQNDFPGWALAPSGDVDLFQIYLQAGSTSCLPGTTLHYAAQVKVFAGSATLGASDEVACGGVANAKTEPLGFCASWDVPCLGNGSTTLYIRVDDPAATTSCDAYALQVLFYGEGTPCP